MEISSHEIISSLELEAEKERKWSYPRSLTMIPLPSSPIIEGVIGKRLKRENGREEQWKIW